jgi:hypothetical protein
VRRPHSEFYRGGWQWAARARSRSRCRSSGAVNLHRVIRAAGAHGVSGTHGRRIVPAAQETVRGSNGPAEYALRRGGSGISVAPACSETTNFIVGHCTASAIASASRSRSSDLWNAALSSRDRGVRLVPSLVAPTRGPRPHCSVDTAGPSEVLCQATEERCCRRGGDL